MEDGYRQFAHGQFAREQPPQGIRQQTMFHRMHTGLQNGQGVGRIDGHRFPGQNGTSVHTLVGHPVHHHTGLGDLAHPVGVEGALDGMDAGKGAGLRRMQVHDTAGKAAEKGHAEQPHPPRQHHPIGLPSGNQVRQCCVKGAATAKVVRVGCGLQDDGGNAGVPGAFQTKNAGLVADHSHHLGRQDPGGAGIEKGLQVAAAARNQYHQAGAPGGPGGPIR